MDGSQHVGWWGVFAGRRNLRDAIEDFKRAALGRVKAQTAGNGVEMSVHSTIPHHTLARLIRLTITFTMVSLSCGRLSAISSVSATSALSAIRFDLSLR